MRKLAIALLMAVMAFPAVSVAAGNAASFPKAAPEMEVQGDVTLRESATVQGKLVQLGDLFTNTGTKAGIAVAYAPQAGKRAVLDARWLYRVARKYGLAWRPLGLRDQITVERESQIISQEEIKDAIMASLMERGLGKGITLELSNKMMRLYVPGNASVSIGVEDVNYEARTGRFTAVLLVPASGPGAIRTRVTGRLFEMTEIPVLSRRMMANERIRKGDIKWIKVRNNRLRRGIVTDINELIGKAGKRGLRRGLPVQENSIRRPILVAKGSLVTIILKIPKMTLTAQGKALENGSDGDTIQISNTQSSKVIEAEVTGPGRVTVLTPSQLAMN